VRSYPFTSVHAMADFPTTAGTGLAGAIFPVTVEAALGRFGFRTTLRALSVGLFLLTFPLLKFVKPRIPPAVGAGRRRFDLSFLWSPVFLLFQLAGIMQGLGYFIPIVGIPAVLMLVSLEADLCFRSTSPPMPIKYRTPARHPVQTSSPHSHLSSST